MGNVWVIDMQRGCVVRSDEYWPAMGEDYRGPFSSEFDAQRALETLWQRLNRQAAEYARLMEMDNNEEQAFGWLP
jgi:hypothetical protein